MNINDKLAEMDNAEKFELIKKSSIKEGEKILKNVKYEIKDMEYRLYNRSEIYDKNGLGTKINSLKAKQNSYEMAMTDIKGEEYENITKIKNRMIALSDDVIPNNKSILEDDTVLKSNKKPLNFKMNAQQTINSINVEDIKKRYTNEFRYNYEPNSTPKTPKRNIMTQLNNSLKNKNKLIGVGALVAGGILLFDLNSTRGQQTNSELYGQRSY